MKTLITIIFIGLISFTPVIPEKKKVCSFVFQKKKSLFVLISLLSYTKSSLLSNFIA